MKRVIAWLRGINVGGHRVTMGELKAHFESFGLSDVSTFLASGNVVFSTDRETGPDFIEALERHLEVKLSFPAPVVLRSVAETSEVAGRAEADGFEIVEGGSHYVVFLASHPEAGLRPELDGLESEMDRFVIVGREVHWLIEGKLSESPLFGRGIDQALRGSVYTMRNMNTVRRLTRRES